MVRFGAKKVDSRPPFLFAIHRPSQGPFSQRLQKQLLIILPPRSALILPPN